MYETNVTVVGRLATDVGWSRLGDRTVVANFRVASTERRYDRATGGWVDGEKLFVDVRCWRKLAENAAASLREGRPGGRHRQALLAQLRARGAATDGCDGRGESVAADLARCTVVLKRDRRPATELGAAEDQKPDAQDDANGPAALVGAAPADEG